MLALRRATDKLRVAANKFTARFGVHRSFQIHWLSPSLWPYSPKKPIESRCRLGRCRFLGLCRKFACNLPRFCNPITLVHSINSGVTVLTFHRDLRLSEFCQCVSGFSTLISRLEKKKISSTTQVGQKMADDFTESHSKIEQVLEDEKGGHSVQKDSTFLLEMNLLTVLLSSLSTPGDDCLNFDGEFRKGNQDTCESRIQNRKRELNQVKLGRRPSERFQPIKDWRFIAKLKHISTFPNIIKI